MSIFRWSRFLMVGCMVPLLGCGDPESGGSGTSSSTSGSSSGGGDSGGTGGSGGGNTITCGPGTVLRDHQCVVDEPDTKTIPSATVTHFSVTHDLAKPASVNNPLTMTLGLKVEGAST